MKQYEIGFTYAVEEYGVIALDALDKTEAEEEALLHVKETYPFAFNIDINYSKEI